MNIVAVVYDLSPAGANVLLYIKVVVNDGNQTAGTIEIAPASSAAQLNTALANGVRQMLRDQLGLTVAANAPVTLWNSAAKA